MQTLLATVDQGVYGDLTKISRQMPSRFAETLSLKSIWFACCFLVKSSLTALSPIKRVNTGCMLCRAMMVHKVSFCALTLTDPRRRP